ncbi:FHA domain-containing protein [Streptomyces javensis]|uniref:FHA domain-containing protein n=1 Tax=Streptomyces javensis TaxID=114698 RepID=UPI001FEA98A1|nr:FHA domain-containing protein [Streptomyces javensis]
MCAAISLYDQSGSVAVSRSEEEEAAPAAYVLSRRTTCLVGRASEYGIRLAPTETKASRHHCLLDVNPPHGRVRDLGSSNSTYQRRAAGARTGRPGLGRRRRDPRQRRGTTRLRPGGGAPNRAR